MTTRRAAVEESPISKQVAERRESIRLDLRSKLLGDADGTVSADVTANINTFLGAGAAQQAGAAAAAAAGGQQGAVGASAGGASGFEAERLALLNVRHHIPRPLAAKEPRSPTQASIVPASLTPCPFPLRRHAPADLPHLLLAVAHRSSRQSARGV